MAKRKSTKGILITPLVSSNSSCTKPGNLTVLHLLVIVLFVLLLAIVFVLLLAIVLFVLLLVNRQHND
jgi:hypothetical protein